ncbi:DUF2889 domain-containing protein [Jatrophihabitans sp. DSM 45814]
MNSMSALPGLLGHDPAQPTPQKLANPLLVLPSRRPNSVRRATSLQILPDPSWDLGFQVHAVAQDSSTDAAGVVSTDEVNPLEVSVDAESRIVAIAASLPQQVLDSLVGRPAISGFRAALVTLVEQGVDLSSPTGALLDDLPTVRLISGYARLMNEPPRVSPMPNSHPQLDVCRGWAVGDTAHRQAMEGQSLVRTTTDAPFFAEMLTDPSDFPAEPEPVRDSMRRRRIFEITKVDNGIELYQYFRDSYVDDEGVESSLHEYIVRATAGSDLVLTDIAVEPRALPFPECPLASQNAGALRGSSLRDVHSSVRSMLSGTRGCTHLSDTLRFLRFTEPLSESLL